MAVKIRLSRIGKKHVPFYRIVAVDGRRKRDGAFLEDLGTYNALNTKLVHYKQDRIDYWLSVGAVPTDSFKKLQKLHKKSAGSSQEQVAAKAPTAKAPKKPTAQKPASSEAA